MPTPQPPHGEHGIPFQRTMPTERKPPPPPPFPKRPKHYRRTIAITPFCVCYSVSEAERKGCTPRRHVRPPIPHTTTTTTGKPTTPKKSAADRSKGPLPSKRRRCRCRIVSSAPLFPLSPSQGSSIGYCTGRTPYCISPAATERKGRESTTIDDHKPDPSAALLLRGRGVRPPPPPPPPPRPTGNVWGRRCHRCHKTAPLTPDWSGASDAFV